MPLNLKNLIELTVPEYLIITIFSTLAAALIIGGTLEPLILATTILSLSAIVLGFNAYNQICDIDLDKINKPQRPLPAKKITIKEAYMVSIIFYFIGVALALYTNYVFFLLALTYAVVSILYSNPSIRLRKIPFSSNIFGTLFYAILPFLSAWAITNFVFPQIFFLFFVLIGFIMSPIKDIEDAKGEKKLGFITLPNILGKKKTIYFIIGAYLILIIAMLALSSFNIINNKFLYPSIFSIIVLLILAKIFLNLIKKKETVVTQSKTVTLGMTASILIQLSYGIANLLLK
ncbi:MAG: UbiA family prenyltransferase [Candidatus Diapherotrites archaeon]